MWIETSLRARVQSMNWYKVLQRAFRNPGNNRVLGSHWPVSYSDLLSFSTATCLGKIKEVQVVCWHPLSVIDGTRAQRWESSSHKSAPAYLILLLASANSTLHTKACVVDNVIALIQRHMQQDKITLRSSWVVEIYTLLTLPRNLLQHQTSGKTKNQMGGRGPERCIAIIGNEKMEEKSKKWWRVEARFEGGQGPEGAVAP